MNIVLDVSFMFLFQVSALREALSKICTFARKIATTQVHAKKCKWRKYYPRL